MTDGKHTPGPWHTALDRGSGHTIVGLNGVLATTFHPNSEANARLIAAAPTMLEALREIEAKAARLVGTFFSACDGKHALGRECDYCLTSDLLTNARAAVEQATHERA